MRQRVLLVAGWVVAAAVTSLVASGAVAVAGGQVNDRPLSRVLAAVPAVPLAENAEGAPVPDCEPPASGGFDCTPGPSSVGVPPAGPGPSDRPNLVGDEKDHDLAQLDPEFPDGIEPSVDAGLPEDAGPVVATPSAARAVTITGGSTSVAVNADRIVLLWAIAEPGYSVEVTRADNATLRVTFSRDDQQSGVVARWEDDDLIVETFEGVH